MALSFRDWLRRIVREDDPANGGHGLLAYCATCQGAGTIPASGADQYAGTDDAGQVVCSACDGSGFAYNGKATQ